MVHPLLTAQGIEKRMAPRVSYKTKALFKADWRANRDCLVRDVSTGGAFLVAQERLFVKTEVIIYLPVEIAGQENVCMLSGTVVRIETKEGHAVYGYGIQFAPMSRSNALILKRFLQAKTQATSPEQAIQAQ
jgi:hypothetical protein